MKTEHYLIYKTTCLITGKIYIGQHHTYDLYDGYLGSGRELKLDIQKFGRDKFTREILFDFDTFEEMNEKEKELVTEEFIFRDDTYNIRVGGQNPDLTDIIQKSRESLRNHLQDEKFRTEYRFKISETMKRKWRENPERYKNTCVMNPIFHGTTFAGKRHTQQTKEIIGKKASIHQKGSSNSQFGTVWIYNTTLKRNMKIKKDQINEFLSNGWLLGRRMLFN